MRPVYSLKVDEPVVAVMDSLLSQMKLNVKLCFFLMFKVLMKRKLPM